MVFFGGNKKDDSDSNDGDSFYGKSLLQRNNSTPDQAIGSQMSNMNLYGNPSTSLAGSDFNTDFWNRTIGSNTNPSNKGFGQNVIGSSFPNLPSSTTRTSNNSILQPQSSRNGTAQSNNIFGANPQSSSELLNSFQNFKLLSGQSSPQQNTQQQRSVIGQMPGMQGHSSPSHSPGLGLKPPVGGGSAVSRPIGMPPVNSIGSSTPPPGPQQPNNLGFVGGQLMRSMSSGNFSQGLLSTSSGDPSIINYSTAPLTSLGNVNTKGGNAFDNDFPALANKVGNSSNSRTGQSSFSFVMSTSNKNMEGNQEFQIQNEDFPALPGANSQIQSDGMPIGLSSLSQDVNPIGHLIQHQDSKESADSFSLGSSSYEQILKDGRLMEKKSRTPVSGIQTNSSGVITNIPSGMVTDQFGMIGLLTFIRAAETEPNLVTLALGSDLTTLGLNLTSTEGLFHTFGSPFSDTTCKPHEIDFYAPHEYLISSYIRDKLAPIKLGRYGEDLLFYLYYTNCGDILQLAAAAELYARDWRYHKEERVWITRFPGMEPQMKTNTYERGTYYYFDSQGWRKVAKEFHVEYDKLEEKPTAQALQQQQQQQQQQQVL